MSGVITLRKSGHGGPEGVAPNAVLRVRANSMSDEVDLSEGIISDNGIVVTVAGDLDVTGSLIGSTSVTGADPTVSVGLTAINGSANTFMRSDAAPALDVSISPVWTGVHKYVGGAPLVFDGATGGTFTTTINITDPTADRTITIPNASIILAGTNINNSFSTGQTFNVGVSLGSATYLAAAAVNNTTGVGANMTTGAIAGVTVSNRGTSLTGTSGAQRSLEVVDTFAPASGTATYAALSLVPTINQTGSGITRGLYINPTLTAAADFRALESTNGSWILGGTGALLLPDGTVAAPVMAFVSAPTTGFYRAAAAKINVALGGVNALQFATSTSVYVLGMGDDTFLHRFAAANFQLGNTASATPVAQTLSAQDGVGTDIAGTIWTLRSNRATGAGAPGTIALAASAAALGSGTTLQTAVTHLTIGAGAVKLGSSVNFQQSNGTVRITDGGAFRSSDNSAGVSAGPFTAITGITVKDGIVTALTGS